MGSFNCLCLCYYCGDDDDIDFIYFDCYYYDDDMGHILSL